jgi:hypothetical protein
LENAEYCLLGGVVSKEFLHTLGLVISGYIFMLRYNSVLYLVFSMSVTSRYILAYFVVLYLAFFVIKVKLNLYRGIFWGFWGFIFCVAYF